eukprot:Nk52_evm1s493 gene=Nk52_evmTU1s493
MIQQAEEIEEGQVSSSSRGGDILSRLGPLKSAAVVDSSTKRSYSEGEGEREMGEEEERERRRGDGGGGGRRRGSTVKQPQKSVEGWVVIVTGLHEEANEDDFGERMGDYGTVKSLSMPLDRQTGYIKGYALVEYLRYEDARAATMAATECDKLMYLGQPIVVDWAFVKGPGGGSTGRRRHGGGGGHRYRR